MTEINLYIAQELEDIICRKTMYLLLDFIHTKLPTHHLIEASIKEIEGKIILAILASGKENYSLVVELKTNQPEALIPLAEIAIKDSLVEWYLQKIS